MSAIRLSAVPALLLALSAHAAPPTIAGCQVFPAQNAWNTPVDTLQVHASSAAWVSTIGATSSLHPDFGTFYLGAPIGIPFVAVPGTQPLVPVAFDQAGESDPGPYPIPADAPIEGGSSSGGDRHVLVLEQASCSLYELFSAYPQGGGTSWTAYSGARFDLRANAMRPDTWTSADAAGLPILPGLVRYDEVNAGEIDHAIRFTVPQTRNAYLWPATHQASSLTGAQYPPMGARFRLKASVDISAYAPKVQVILRALKKYGMIVADNGSAWFISGEHNPLWDDGLLSQLGGIKGSDFEAVETAPMVITPASAKAFQPPPAVTLREVASGLSQPLEIVSARDGSARLFIVEKGGAIRILKNGAILPTPFLDLSARVSTSGERGLLGLAFDPQFATSRRFFVYYTMLPDDGTGGTLRVSSFLASASNPDLADPASEAEVISIAHPVNANHNGGHIAFGRDGYLYIGTGDGGSGGDSPNNAQNLSVLLGKLLRLDVSGAGGYAIPPSNPTFAGIAGARREIWAYGLRNPWRFSFDRGTGDLYIGDVGQSAIEEIDYVPAGAPGGLNFGWHVFEGDSCYNATTCSLAGHTPPVQQYAHDASGGIAVTGGYVYRGLKSGPLQGYYIYGDYGSNRVWASLHEGGSWTSFVLVEPPSLLSGISSFGEDENGEIYVASINTGRIHVIEGPSGSTNVALAANGGVASASSVYGPGLPAAAAINGERAGANWMNGSGWNDGTFGVYPDWLQVQFSGPKTIDRVVVYTLQDAYNAPSEPTDTMTFTRYGNIDFTVEGWNGTSWVVLGTVAGNNLVKRTVTFTAFTTDRIRVNITRSAGVYSHITELEAWTPSPAPPPPASIDVALAANGGVPSASSVYGPQLPVAAVNNGERAGANWMNGSGWNDATPGAYPDWVQLDFNGPKAIDRVVVYTLQDAYNAPSEPTDTMTFTKYGLADFTVDGWNGTAWVTLATVAGNNLVKRTVTFATFTTSRIRVNITRSQGVYSHITEIEAWGVAAGPVSSNVALASTGAVASASSVYGPGLPVSAVNNGERAGANWMNGSGWNDATPGAYPDWVQVAFNGTKTIDRVVVYTLQDAYNAPSEPTDMMTFTKYGIADFTVDGWNGSAWVTLATVTGNNLVKRTVTFAPFATDRVRVNITLSRGIYSHITEIEAWGG